MERLPLFEEFLNEGKTYYVKLKGGHKEAKKMYDSRFKRDFAIILKPDGNFEVTDQGSGVDLIASLMDLEIKFDTNIKW